MKHINLTQMLQGCSKRNGMTVSASMHDDGQSCDGNRQSRLMSLSGKKAEKEQLSPSCLLSASFPLSFRSRYLRYAAVIFCVLAMSIANIGTAWGDNASWMNNTMSPASYFTLGSNTSAATNAQTIGGTSYTHSINMTSKSNQSSNNTNGHYIRFTLTSASNVSILFKAIGSARTLRVCTGWSYDELTNNATAVSNGGTPSGGVMETSSSVANGSTGTLSANGLAAGTYYICGSGSVSIFKITIATPCAAAPDAPSAFAKSSVTATTATFSITDAGNAPSYDIYTSTSSTAPEGGTTPTATGITTKTPTITSLTAGTTYYAWVRAVCDGSYKSSWVALTSSTFTTKAQYTITYNKGANGTGSISAGTKTEGEDFTLSSSVFTRANYAQTGWATSDGGSKAYDLGGTYSTDAAITLYPVWTATTTYTFKCTDDKTITQLESAGWSFNSKSEVSMSATGAFVNLVKTFTDHSINVPGTDGSGYDYAIAIAKSTDAYARFDLGQATTVTAVTGNIRVGTKNDFNITIKYLGSDGSTVLRTSTTAHSKTNWGTNAINDATPVANVKYIQIQGAGSWQIMDTLHIKYASAITCPSAYSFHYGTHDVADWTVECFERVGATNEWKIDNFVIPNKPNFWVGWEGRAIEGDQSVEKAWTDELSDLGNGVMNGAMVLLPTNGSVVGNATGAKGRLSIWSSSSSKNQYVGFKPDGYSIRYSASDHVFAETATANMWETDVVTLPDVSTTYTMEIKTADGYTTCYHSNAPEAISNMGVTNVAGGKKAIYLVPGSFDDAGAKYAVYDVTNGVFDSDFMTDDDGDGIYVGYVGSNCSSMVLCRMNSDATTSDLSSKNWDKRWNQTANIGISGDLAKKYTITNMTTWNECAYTTANMQPITGQKGKFRMWANSNDNNWYVHFIPYYVLSYDANGGSGTTAATERNSESSTITVSVASSGFTPPTGKHFDHWDTEEGDGGTDYAEGADYTLTADATLYAQWANNQYSVTHSGLNRGVTSGTTGANAATYGTDYTAKFSETTGYNLPATITVTIGGNTTTQGTEYTWNQGTGTVVVDGDYILGDVVITVNGVLKTYTVTFVSNNDSYGTVSSSSISSVPHGSTVSINGSTNALTLNGSTITVLPTTSTAAYTYAFDHWSVDNGDEITGTTTITATFTRTAKTYDVDVTLTDSKTTKKSGTTGSNAATFGTNHTLEFEAVSGYELPDDVTVIIGSDEATKGVEYTWSVSEGVGTLQIGGLYILGNIAITVTATSTCSTPADPDGLAAGSISSSGVTFTITDDESPASYEIYYSTDDDAPEASTDASATTTSTTKSVTGLTANTTYYAWVRAVCDEDYKSDWVALGTSTFKTLATGTKYYLFTPTKNAEPAHTGTLSGQFLCKTSDPNNNSQTIDGHSMSHWCKFSQQPSLSSGSYYFGKTYLAYDIKTNSTDFTLYFYNNASAAKDIYYALVQEGITSAPTPVKVGSASANSTGKATFTITASKNTRILFYTTDASNMRCHQIVAEESGSALPKPGTSGYKIGFKGTYSRFSDYSEGTNKQGSLDDSVKVVCYSNYGIGSSDALKIHTKGTDYISFRTGASACQVKVCVSSSKTYYLGTSASATTNEQTSTHTFALAANTRYYINPNGSDVTVDSIVFLPAPAGFTVSIAANPSDYGSVSASSVSSVASGTTLSASTNTLSVGATDVTATATSASAEYTYAFSNWTKSDGTDLPLTVTSDLSVYANFTRTANNYTLTWNTNGGSDLECDDCTSGSTAYGATIVAPTDPTKSNYTFDGWKTNNDGTGSGKASTMPAAATTYYAAWKQTVTLKTGAQGSGADQTPYVYINGTRVSSFTPHTASGYTLQGYYTAGSGGVKVLNADGTFAAANVTDYITSSKWLRTGAAPTLYAQWRVSAGSTCYEWDADVTTPSTGTNSYDGLYLTAATIKNSVSFYSGHAADTCFSVSDQCKTLYGHLNGTEIDSVVFAASSSKAADNNTMVVIFCSTQTFDTANIIKVNNYQATLYTVNQNTAAKTVHRIKAPAGTKSFAIGRNYANITVSGTLHNSGERYLYYLKVCSASGGTHTISYDNGGGTGTMSAETDIEDDGSQTLTTNSFTAPTNFAFAGWVADVDVTIGGSTVTAGTLIADGATITNITMDIALTAKWSQTITLDDNDANHGTTGDGSATVYYNATSLASITHTTAASGYKLAGYYTAATSGTKVLNSDGSFAGDDITDWIDDGKWVQNDDDEPLLYAQYEVAGSIKWNLQVNSADAPIVTSSKNSSYTQISTSNMTNLDSIGLNITASKKGGMTSKITAPTAFDKDKYMKVTFQVASGYQFKPSSIKVPIQPVDGGADVKLVLVDNAATPDSIGKVQSSLSKGTLTTVEMTNSSAVFKGTVTLKIYCYGSSTGTYRLGTPIQIDGEIESTCTMPSYTSVSYSQTEYVQPASASAISVVGASGDPSYQWKYNSTGDRTSGTNCGTEASVTPSTESTGTLYYWCELTNACGTVKTPAVAITVSASKSTATVTWTDPSTPNYGGGGYTIKATVNEAWDGNASDLIITAPAGIRIYDKTSGTDGSGKKYVQVKFDVQTALDRSTYEDKIPFTVSADATATYNAISADHNVSYSACSGGGGSATEELMPVDDSHMDNSTWKGGWVYDGIGMMRYGHGSSDVAPGTKNANLVELTYKMADDDVDTYYKSSANHFGFYTEKAITGIRLYVHTTNDEVTVSGVYVANSAYSTGTPSTGSVSFTAEYNDDNESLRSGTHSGSAWVDITFASEVAAGKYGQINLSSNVRIAGMAFISASGSGATLTTTLAFASSSVTKAQSDANFTITPTKGDYSETLGAITYSSSNTDCATVNATTGEVTITATGSSNLTSRITATLAASGCYKSATAYYDLTVTGQECTITSAGTLSADKTVKCSSANVTLTLSGEDDGMTVTWYRDATNVTGSVLDHTLTTSAAGSYSVVVSNATCSKRSNSITISNYSAEVAATKIVDKWYIKNGRVTPDIALWALDEGTHLSSVAWSPSNGTGLTAADFYESDGIVYLKGKEPSSNESSDVEYTLTLTVKDECENTTALSTSDKQITLTHQKNTDKHVLAFVVTGTEKGGWTAGISADQTTNVELYNEIAKNFDVQATNIYSTDDEQKLKEYYSQFDILCITDYPNTGKTGTNKKSYVDAIGSLIDIRPILTMEAFVSKLDNWKSKGISGTPKSPTTRQYSMLLQCKDHEIFSGTNPTTVGSGDETMYRIDMVDKTMEEYATLDATYGAGAHVEKSGYEYGSKPALQGFTYDASMSSLLPIGRIDDGAGNDLEVGVERQAVMEARLLVLGINGYAMERLDDDGVTIVINALKYLMKKNAEDISDCSNYFVGGAEGDPYSWKNLDNWSGSSLPDRTQEVRIVAPCVISDTIARASSVKIVTGGTYSHGTKTANGSLTINPTGSLIVEGKIYAATAPNFFEQRATEPEDLVVKADDSYTGTLIFDNEDGETQATIEMYSKSYWETVEGKYKKYWSYVGMPIKDVHIPDYFYGAFTYYYNETKGWERRFDNDIMQPFEGIGLSMQTGHKETFYGTMVSTENVDIKLTSTTGYGDGDNLIGNSWTAPIQIANFDASDFGDALATIYIFNTGREGNTYVDATVENKGVAKAGQWLGVPISVAGLEEYTGLKVVPAMNAFLVYNDEGAGTTTTMHLDYEKLVRDGASSNTQINEPMRAPKQDGRRKKKDVEGLMRIRVAGEKTNTDVWMMQDPRFSEAFDNGWEAYYTTCDDRSAQLYARSSNGKMSFLALPDLDGTVLGFAPSRDGNDYTFTFKYRGEDEYYLNDLKLQQSVLINADNTYDFIYEKGDTNRFYVSRTPLQAPQTPTGIGNTEGTSTQSVKAIKVIYNDKLYIIRGGRVYSADGSLVK